MTPREVLLRLLDLPRGDVVPTAVYIDPHGEKWPMERVRDVLKDIPLQIVMVPQYGYDWSPVLDCVGRFHSVTSTCRNVGTVIEIKLDTPADVRGTRIEYLSAVHLVSDKEVAAATFSKHQDIFVVPMTDPTAETKFVIPAEAHSDDHVIEVKFDALEYFLQATAEELLLLAGCGFGGDYPADNVAQYLAETNKPLEKLFDYLEAIADVPSKKDCNGFECNVDETAARTWLAENRPQVFALLATKDAE